MLSDNSYFLVLKVHRVQGYSHILFNLILTTLKGRHLYPSVFQLGVILPPPSSTPQPQGHLAMSSDIFHCHNCWERRD